MQNGRNKNIRRGKREKEKMANEQCRKQSTRNRQTEEMYKMIKFIQIAQDFIARNSLHTNARYNKFFAIRPKMSYNGNLLYVRIRNLSIVGMNA